MKKILGLFVVLFALCLSSVPVNAANYDYTITVRSGGKGTFSGGGNVVTYTAKQGDVINLMENTVDVTDEKYFMRGINESGKELLVSQVTVDKDMEYVVAYGIKGTLVQYTVQYLDEEGNELAPADTYYGNVGEKPIVSYLYFENYQPNAYSLTKTLSENEADNVFPFTYTKIIGKTETITKTELVDGETTVVPGTTTVVPGTTTVNEGTDDGATGTTDGAGNAQGTTDAADNADAGVNAEDVQAPLETLDLDDVDAPLANVELDNANGIVKNSYIILGSILFAVALAAIAIMGVFKKRKKETVEEEDNQQ